MDYVVHWLCDNKRNCEGCELGECKHTLHEENALRPESVKVFEDFIKRFEVDKVDKTYVFVEKEKIDE